MDEIQGESDGRKAGHGGMEVFYLEAPKEGEALRKFNDFLAESLQRYECIRRQEEEETLIARRKAHMLYRSYALRRQRASPR